ncbi:hypothetical protein BZA70DRAFT_93106 [Myxozyma melibiosi]|uniref:Biogenesis of lysosome-related organelles complex 1 subunit 1 n=1 Tax=Myxozyma melibiosi TaxID=54550 RepID=A0ABR1EYZ9_9ASCO
MSSASVVSSDGPIDSKVDVLQLPAVTADLRRQFYKDLQSLTQYVDRDLRQRITSVHANSKHIATQSKEIRVRTGALAKDATKWEELSGKATQALKEAGDVQNWAEILEVEISALEETMRIVRGEVDDEDEEDAALSSKS